MRLSTAECLQSWPDTVYNRSGQLYRCETVCTCTPLSLVTGKRAENLAVDNPSVCPSGCYLVSCYSSLTRHYHAADVDNVRCYHFWRVETSIRYWSVAAAILQPTSPSVRTSCCSAASRVRTSNLPAEVICVVQYVLVHFDDGGLQQPATSSTSDCQPTDTTKGLRTRPALRRQHSDDKEELLSPRPRHRALVRSSSVKR